MGDEHADTAWSLYNLAFILINLGRHNEAEQYLREIFAKRGANLPEEHPVVGSSLLLLGRIFAAQKKFHEALAAFSECLDLRRRTLPAGHWLLASTKSFLGESLIYVGEAERGKQMMCENYEILKEKLGANHEQTQQAFERTQKLF